MQFLMLYPVVGLLSIIYVLYTHITCCIFLIFFFLLARSPCFLSLLLSTLPVGLVLQVP